MKTYTKTELKEILTLHQTWLDGENEGVNANLRGADLSWADLSWANLWGTIGNMGEIKSLQLETYTITYTVDRLQIGCKDYAIEEWFNFSDAEITGMDSSALEWWKKWRDYIKQTLELSPAAPTHKEK